MKSPIAYIGGKSRVANKIIAMMPPHKTYVELFAGAAWVFSFFGAAGYLGLQNVDKLPVSPLFVLSPDRVTLRIECSGVACEF